MSTNKTPIADKIRSYFAQRKYGIIYSPNFSSEDECDLDSSFQKMLLARKPPLKKDNKENIQDECFRVDYYIHLYILTEVGYYKYT